MKKRSMVGLIAGGLLAATASPAFAGPPMLLISCSDGFQLIDPWPLGSDPDRNENGRVCGKVVYGGPTPVEKIMVLTDDHPLGPPLG